MLQHRTETDRIDRRIGLRYDLKRVALIDREILAANVRNEVALRILDEHFDHHDLSSGVEMNFRPLLTLRTLKQRRRWPIWNLYLRPSRGILRGLRTRALHQD